MDIKHVRDLYGDLKMIHPKTNLIVGKKCSLAKSASIGYNENGKGKIILGDKVRVKENVILRTCGGAIEIGSNTIINYNCVFHCMGSLKIGNDCLISPNVSMFCQNRGIKKSEKISLQPQYPCAIIINSGVWIGANSVILGGVTIGHGAVIGAGSVVTKDVGDFEIWCGNPAVKKGERT